MGILADYQIQRDVKIEPFAPAQKREGVVSYGLTSYGYDVRLGYKFRVLRPWPNEVIDPKNFDMSKMMDTVDLTPGQKHDWDPHPPRDRPGCVMVSCKRCRKISRNDPKDDLERCPSVPNYIDIPPHGFVLGESLEKFTIPRDVLCVNVGKSTYARCGLIVNVTPGEPEWSGVWTLELSNTTDRYLRVYAGEGIMQSMFFRTDGRYELALAAIHTYLTSREEGPEALELLRRLALCEQPVIEDPLRRDGTHRGNLEGSCIQSYADKKGKYQNQGGLTAPTVDRETELNLLRKEAIEAYLKNPGKLITLPTEFRVHVKGLPGALLVAAPSQEAAEAIARKDGHQVIPMWQPGSNQDVPDRPTYNARWRAFPPSNPDGSWECLWCDGVFGGKLAHNRPGSSQPCREPGTVLDSPIPPEPRAIPNPNEPPIGADKNRTWMSPDGSSWNWHPQRKQWIQSTEPSK